MVTQGQRHELQKEVRRLNIGLANILRDYDYTGDYIPASRCPDINKDTRFKELRARRDMFSKILGILNLRVEADFTLLPYEL